MVDEPTWGVDSGEWDSRALADEADDAEGWMLEEWASCCSAEEIELARRASERRRGRQRRMALLGVGLLLVAVVSTVSAAVVGVDAQHPRAKATISVLYEARCPRPTDIHPGSSTGGLTPLRPGTTTVLPPATHSAHCAS